MTNNRIRFVTTLVTCAIACATAPPAAAWVPDGVPVCLADSLEINDALIADGLGGTIIAWEDRRGGDADVYAQRLDANGDRLWGADGALVYSAGNDQKNIALVSDGAGGVIITWEDNHAGVAADIMAQRLYADGTRAWIRPATICDAGGWQFEPEIAPDGAGGAIIVWSDRRSGVDDVYAQRVNSSGATLWIEDGIGVCMFDDFQYYPVIVAASPGAFIIVWMDYRSGTQTDLYAQRLNLSGLATWTADGVAVCTVGGSVHQRAVADGAGGAIVAWEDYRGEDTDIYAQRIAATGSVQWGAAGRPICTFPDDQNGISIGADGFGGAVLCWTDFRFNDPPGSAQDAYAQRVDAAGNARWPTGGIPVREEPGDEVGPRLAADGHGGAIVTWSEWISDFNYDVVAQHVSDVGGLSWGADGTNICATPDKQLYPRIASDGLGGAFITWTDFRGDRWDIYAQYTGFVVTSVAASEVQGGPTALAIRPNPFNPNVTISFELRESGPVCLRVFDVRGRLVRTLADKPFPAGHHDVHWDGRGDDGRRLPSGVYVGRLQAGGHVAVSRMTLAL